MPPEQNHRRRSMSWNEGSFRVDHMREVGPREKLLDELFAKLAFHERVCRDLPRESARRAGGREPARRAGAGRAARGRRRGDRDRGPRRHR